MKHTLDWFGKSLEVESRVVLNNEEQYGEADYDAILLLVADADENYLRDLHDVKILVVKEAEIKKATWLKELGY